MSYINEALQKVQKERNSNSLSYADAVAKHATATRSSYITIIFRSVSVIILVALTSYSWFNIFFGTSNKQKENIDVEIVSEIEPPTKELIKENSNSVLNTSKNLAEKKIETENKTKIETETNIEIETETENENTKTETETETETEYTEETQNFNIASTSKHETKKKSVKDSEPAENDSVLKQYGQNIPTDKFLKASRLYKQGVANQVKGDYKKALKLYKECIELINDMSPALNNMGVIYMKEGQFSEAKMYFEKAIRNSPSYVDPYYNLACMHSQMYNIDKALFFLRKAVSMSANARKWASTDKDFQPLYELTEFNMIISGN